MRKTPNFRRARHLPLVLGALAVVGAAAAIGHDLKHGGVANAPREKPLTEIPLRDDRAQPTTLGAFAGRWQLLFFGYTTCPDVCPTTLAYLARELEELGPAAAAVAPIFVSVDPERDTPERLGLYVHSFSPRIAALSGTVPDLEALTKALGAHFKRLDAEGSAAEYLMAHPSSFYILDPLGRFVKSMPQPLARGDVAREMRRLTGAPSH
jgi:protein SCO1/2